jgi:hypothetical protein
MYIYIFIYICIYIYMYMYIHIYVQKQFIPLEALTQLVMKSNRPAGEMGHPKWRWYQTSGQGLTPK